MIEMHNIYPCIFPYIGTCAFSPSLFRSHSLAFYPFLSVFYSVRVFFSHLCNNTKAAVPKSMQLQLDPPSSSTIPSGGSVNQQMIVQNPSNAALRYIA